MPPIAGEPFRGFAVCQVFNTAITTNQHNAYLSIDPALTFGDQAVWEGAPGASFTLHFAWNTAGSNSGQQTPNFATVEMRVPGGAIVGAAWAVAFPTATTIVTRTLHLDADPLNQLLGALRAGTLEMYLNWGSTGGALPWSLDSRGNSAGILGSNSVQWARGYVRSKQRLTSHSISNVSAGGAEPASFAYPDPLHTRIGLEAQWYEAAAHELELLSNAGAIERESTLAASVAVSQDFSWTAVGGVTGRVGEGMVAGADVKDLRVKLPAADFGGDNKFIFDTAGHQANWTRDSDLQMTRADRITADPRITASHLMQMNDNAFGTPPSSKNDSDGKRLVTDLAFLSARFVNARGEGQNGLTILTTMQDAGGLTTATTQSEVTATKGGEAGWVQNFKSWADSLPGGAWTKTVDITAPADIDDNSFLVGNSQGYTLLASDPSLVVIVAGGTAGAADQGDHWHPGEPLLVGAALYHSISKQLVAADAAPVPTVVIGRFNVTFGRAQYLAADLSWQFLVGGATAHEWALTQSPGDPNIWIKTFTDVETAAFDTAGLFFVAVLHRSSTPYRFYSELDPMGTLNAHDHYVFDGAGLLGFPSK